jgi:tRNA modification GTPase
VNAAGGQAEGARFIVASKVGGGGAIAVVQVMGDWAGVLRRLGVAPPPIGCIGLRRIPGVDDIVVGSVDGRWAVLTPHAGPAIVERLRGALRSAGAVEVDGVPARALYPEARTDVEAEMLRTLARAASPRAVDLLLDQPRRWDAGVPEVPAATARRLSRLIYPPIVVLRGAPNIGKSSLVNALARRSVSIVADYPGTTRDHVGVTLDLAGLVVHAVDTPGVGASADDPAIQCASHHLVEAVVRDAELVLLCADGGSDFLDGPRAGVECLRVGLRSDLGPVRSGRADVCVSVRTGAGIEDLVGAIKERLVPAVDLDDPRAWRFWEAALGLPDVGG